MNIVHKLHSSSHYTAAEHALHELHRQEAQYDLAEAAMTDLVRSRTHCLDRVVKTLWRANAAHTGYSLIAVGGYGAGTLHPHSDIDLLVLRMPGSKIKESRSALANFMAQLWDLNLVVGYSLRTPQQCLSAARHDISIMSSLMDMRVIAGHAQTVAELRKKLQRDDLWPLANFLKAKLAERQQREQYLSMSDTPLQPNVKKSRGGLRDLQSLSLLAKRAYKVNSFAALVGKGILAADECRSLERGRDFLWRLRWALHSINRRAMETLLFDQQATLAEHLAYGQGTRGASKLLRAYYLRQRDIINVETIFIRQLEQRLKPRTTKRVTINKNFSLRGGYVEVSDPDLFSKQPAQLIELFAQLKRAGVRGIAPTSLRLIRRASDCIEHNFRHDAECKKALLELLRKPGLVARALSEMAQHGVLGAYWPAFEKITGLAQFDMFHIYPVDQHTLAVIENIDAYRKSSQHNRQTLGYKLFRQVHKKELLYLAAMFHDVCKGRRGDHSDLGADESYAFCRQHGLDEQDAQHVAWLVRHHLLMSMTAQRKDISDPRVVQAFTKQLGSLERLNQLYLLTIADIKATNPAVWNAWKDALLSELYQASRQQLQRGLEQTSGRRVSMQQLCRAALARLASKHHAAYKRVWRKLSAEYFSHSNEEDIINDAQVLMNLKDDDQVFVQLHKNSRHGSSVITVFSHKSHDLFARLTRVFSLKRLNIVAAYLGSSRAGRAINRFLVLEPNGLPIMDERRAHEIETALYDAFRYSDLPVYQPPINPYYQQNPNGSELEFDCSGPAPYTTIELRTVDHSGLLSAVADVFLELQLRIVEARINTVGKKVDDLFKVYSESMRLSDAQTQATIRAAICTKINQLPDSLIA